MLGLTRPLISCEAFRIQGWISPVLYFPRLKLPTLYPLTRPVRLRGRNSLSGDQRFCHDAAVFRHSSELGDNLGLTALGNDLFLTSGNRVRSGGAVQCRPETLSP